MGKEVTVELTDAEVAYVRTFRQQVKQKPLSNKVLNTPSVVLFLKLAEAVGDR